jgi:hypothetical protein
MRCLRASPTALSMPAKVHAHFARKHEAAFVPTAPMSWNAVQSDISRPWNTGMLSFIWRFASTE